MIGFRPLSPEDYPLLVDWLQRPHVKEWWDDGDDTLERVAASYSADPETTKRFIAQVEGRDAGYFQYYPLEAGHIGADQFLAHADLLSQGLGTRALLAFVELIRDRESPQRISVDPDPANARAVRCYEKCGFVHDQARSTPTVYFMTKTLRPAR